jgi:type I restriction enzyme R subunit
MDLVKRLKAAYDVCCGSEQINEGERNHIHFYLAIRSIVYKLTKGEVPDTAQMNAKVPESISEALQSDGVEEIFKLGNEEGSEVDIFDDDYIAKVEKIKLPNTKIKLLQQILAKAIGELKKVNLAQGVDFTKRFKALVDKYNERKEEDVLVSDVLEDFSDEIINMFTDLKTEMDSNDDLGISFEEKVFYDILKSLAIKYDFLYPEDKLIELSQAVKEVVDDKAKYTDWNNRDDIKAELEAISKQIKTYFSLDFEVDHSQALLNPETPGKHHPDNLQLLLKSHNRKKHSKNWERFSLDEQVEYITTAIKLQEIVAKRLNVQLEVSVLTSLVQRLKEIY